MESDHAAGALFFTVSAVMLIVMVIFIYRAIKSQRLFTWFNVFYLLMIFFWAISAFTDGLASLGSSKDKVIACVSMESTSISLASYANIVLLKARSILAYKQSFSLQQLVHVISFLSVFPTIFFIIDAAAIVPFARVSLGEVALCILTLLVLLMEIVFSFMFRSLHINTELKDADKSFLIIAKHGIFCAILLFSSIVCYFTAKYVNSTALLVCFRIFAGGICLVLFMLKTELSNDREFDNMEGRTRLRANSFSTSLSTLAVGGSRTIAASQTAVSNV